MYGRLLHLYAEVMCRAIWVARKVFPAGNDAPVPNFLRRDYEWTASHRCEACGHDGRHRFIEWLPERTVTAECPRCGLEATIS